MPTLTSLRLFGVAHSLYASEYVRGCKGEEMKE